MNDYAHDRIEIVKLGNLPWAAIRNPSYTSEMLAAHKILRSSRNGYVEYENCGIQIRIIRRRDLENYGLLYDLPGLSRTALDSAK